MADVYFYFHVCFQSKNYGKVSEMNKILILELILKNKIDFETKF